MSREKSFSVLPVLETDTLVAKLTKLAVVIVTYHPDLEILERQLSQLPDESNIILVDNGSSESRLVRIRTLVAVRPKVILLENKQNLGLAAGINLGAAQATKSGMVFLLMLDQDTEPGIGGVEQLLAGFLRLEAEQSGLICLGPSLQDAGTGLYHGFHQIKFGRWTRQFPEKHMRLPIPRNSLNGSGTLCQLELFNTLGGLDESFFIDHVDTEWSFRAKAAGCGLYGISDIYFIHRMGDETWRFWLFGWRVWPYRSSQRHYYLYRNVVRLMRRSYVPLVWKFWAVLKLLLTMMVHVALDEARNAQWHAMARGVRDGLARKGGEGSASTG